MSEGVKRLERNEVDSPWFSSSFKDEIMSSFEEPRVVFGYDTKS
jgi:hypothetical protein